MDFFGHLAPRERPNEHRYAALQSEKHARRPDCGSGSPCYWHFHRDDDGREVRGRRRINSAADLRIDQRHPRLRALGRPTDLGATAAQGIRTRRDSLQAAVGAMVAPINPTSALGHQAGKAGAADVGFETPRVFVRVQRLVRHLVGVTRKRPRAPRWT